MSNRTSVRRIMHQTLFPLEGHACPVRMGHIRNAHSCLHPDAKTELAHSLSEGGPKSAALIIPRTDGRTGFGPVVDPSMRGDPPGARAERAGSSLPHQSGRIQFFAPETSSATGDWHNRLSGLFLEAGRGHLRSPGQDCMPCQPFSWVGRPGPLFLAVSGSLC